MLRFLIRRIISGILVLWLISMLVFALFFAVPSDVGRKLAGHQASPETIARIEARLHLDEPLYKQYAHYMGNALKGDFGQDYYFQIPVSQVIKQGVPVTASLTLGASILWLIMGVSGGVISAVRPRSLVDRALTVLSVAFFSIPAFVLGLSLLYFFYYRLSLAGFDWFPANGYVPLSDGVVEWAKHLILPWFTLAMISAATYTRLTRGSMMEVLSEDYIRTARAKGLSERRVTYRHALRSALTPIVTQFGIDVGALLGGAVLTEKVFGLDGLGARSVDAIRNQDLPVVMGIVLVASAFVVVANIVVDLLYAYLDPRVRLS
ncbi:MAG: transporter permease [Marmoricola sp.]|nr:transporter permease [Marmoricola sp.]